MTDFQVKPQGDGGWINGRFFMLEPEVIDRIDANIMIWEQEPLRSLAADGKLTAYSGLSFWRPMATLRDRVRLEELWAEGNALWKVW